MELGCGAADWSIALRRRGARPVGIDASSARVRQAEANAQRNHSYVPLVEGTAERLPFGAATFDIVFSDWGAMTFADPRATVPEVARVLSDGGRFVFCTDSPVHVLTYDLDRDRPTRTLRRDYFGLHRISTRDSIEFQLPYGEWIDLFRRHGLRIEGLLEPRPGPNARSTYRSRRDRAWARRWPEETIWHLVREPRAPPQLKTPRPLRTDASGVVRG